MYMKRFYGILSLMILLLMSGCAQTENTETVPATTATVETVVAETVTMQTEATVPEPTEPEPEEPPELWFPTVTQGVNMYFPCLLDNLSSETLTVQSLKVVYSLNGAEVETIEHTPGQIAEFTNEWEKDLTLRPGEPLIRRVHAKLPQDTFDQAVLTFMLTDTQGQNSEQTFRFTTDESKVTANAFYPGEDWIIARTRYDSWKYWYEVSNPTDSTLTLKASYIIFSMDGVPVMSYKEVFNGVYTHHIGDIAVLEPGYQTNPKTAYNDQHEMRNTVGQFNQRRVVFVYENELGEPYFQTFNFLMDGPYDPDKYHPILEDFKAPLDTDPPQYTFGEIKQMVEDDLTLDEVAEKISTVSDLIQYLHVRHYGFGGIYDLPFKYNGITWSVSRKAEQVFEDNRSGCGGNSNLANYILRGDYDEQGYIEETYNRDSHIYNYFVKDGIYYICDFSEIILATDLVLYAGPDPHEFAAQYLEENRAENGENDHYYMYLQFMYPYDGSHRPFGVNKNIKTALNVAPFTIVPKELEDSLILLYAENEDYMPIFMDAPPEDVWPALAK